MRHTLIIFLLLISFPLFAQQQEEDSTMFFGNTPLNYGNVSNFLNGWYVVLGNSFVDSTTIYNGNKSLCITSPSSSSTQHYVGYYIPMDDIEADSIAFECKYKFDPDNKADLYLGIRQLYDNPTNFKCDTISQKNVNKELVNTGNWQDFSITETIKPNLMGIFVFALTSVGDAKIWLNDCKVYFDNKSLADYVNVKYKADDDREFDKASGIRLSSLTPLMIENLEILGKVWGFLKYYHPEVAKGNYNWDYELFRVLPQIANAKNKKERNKLFNRWIDKYGEIKETKDYSISDSSMYSHVINLDWIYDKKMFGEELVSKFNKIRNAKRNHTHYYIQKYHSITDLNKSREPQYLDISWEDQGFRILTLFKFWNAMEYNFPFVEITDRPWNSLLKEFIPRFVEPGDKIDYQETLLELFACINDSHAYYTSSSDLLSGGSGSDYSILPVQVAYTFDHQVVVTNSLVNELKRGDIILKVDNKDIDSIFKQELPYIRASVPSTMIYTILNQLFITINSEITVTYVRSGEERTTIIDATPYKGKELLPPVLGDKYAEERRLASKNIAYINMNTMEDDSISDFIARNRLAKGVIIDMRHHLGHRFRVNDALIRWLLPKEVVYLWSSVNDKSNPGNFICNNKIITGTDNPDHFTGKVAILVNQATMSVGEARSMTYRNAINSKVIGTATAGAVGPMSRFNLPMGIDFSYSANGMYYPDWEPFQRRGVKIDIPVKETVEDIRDGKDVWIEEAIRYIEGD